MKKFLITSILAVSAMLCLSLNAFALTDGDWEFQLLNNEVKITGYVGSGGDVVIPETIYGCPVTKMDDAISMLEDANHKLTNKITSITFPGTLKNIDFGATFGIKELKTLIFSEGVEGVNGCNIQEFPNLTTISLPSTFNRLGPHAFQGTSALKHITLPTGITIIADSAFKESGLEEIDMSYLNVTDLYYTFDECKQLKKVQLPKNLTELKQGVFEDCVSLTEIDIPASVTLIDTTVFMGTSLESVILPTSLKEIGPRAFSGTKLKEVVIPYGTEKIEHFAFSYCPSLKSLYVPDTVTHFDSRTVEDSENVIVYCTENSKTAQSCKKNEISYLTDNSVNSGITVLYNGTRISFHSYGQNPALLQSRTLVPLRSIFEAMGAEVQWDAATNTAIATRDGITVKIQIGANEINKNGTSIPVDVPAQLLNDRTMVPARVIAESFGASVAWNQNGQTVLITE